MPAEIWGWAWSFRDLAAVEISTDGGAHYTPAALGDRRGFAWRRFAFPWRPAERGEMLLHARAIEAGGVAQPRGGARNAIHAVRVFVR